MFEEWAYKEEPSVRLLIARGSDIPAELGSRDWKLLGVCDVSTEIAQKIAQVGYHYVRTDEPIKDPDSLKDSNAAGA